MLIDKSRLQTKSAISTPKASMTMAAASDKRVKSNNFLMTNNKNNFNPQQQQLPSMQPQSQQQQQQELFQQHSNNPDYSHSPHSYPYDQQQNHNPLPPQQPISGHFNDIEKQANVCKHAMMMMTMINTNNHANNHTNNQMAMNRTMSNIKSQTLPRKEKTNNINNDCDHLKSRASFNERRSHLPQQQAPIPQQNYYQIQPESQPSPQVTAPVNYQQQHPQYHQHYQSQKRYSAMTQHGSSMNNNTNVPNNVSVSVNDDDNNALENHQCTVNSSMTIRRLLQLYELGEYREAANIISRLPYSTFRAVVLDLPVDIFVEAIPASLPILDALYVKVFFSGRDLLAFGFKFLHPENVVSHMIKMFAICDVYSHPGGMESISICKKLLKVILIADPSLRKQLLIKKALIDRAVEGMGHHGLVGTSNDALMNLHEALKLEFERVIQQYKGAIAKIDELSLTKCIKDGGPITRSLSQGPAPTFSSHQRLLSLKQEEIQDRLNKNRALLCALEPCFRTNHSLQILLAILQKRIDYDKETLFQFGQLSREYVSNSSTSGGSSTSSSISTPATNSQLNKQTTTNGNGSNSSSNHNHHHHTNNNPNNNSQTTFRQKSRCLLANQFERDSVVAPVLMRFSHGCNQVLNLLKEIQHETPVSETVPGTVANGGPIAVAHEQHELMTHQCTYSVPVGTNTGLMGPVAASTIPANGSAATLPGATVFDARSDCTPPGISCSSNASSILSHNTPSCCAFAAVAVHNNTGNIGVSNGNNNVADNMNVCANNNIAVMEMSKSSSSSSSSSSSTTTSSPSSSCCLSSVGNLSSTSANKNDPVCSIINNNNNNNNSINNNVGLITSTSTSTTTAAATTTATATSTNVTDDSSDISGYHSDSDMSPISTQSPLATNNRLINSKINNNHINSHNINHLNHHFSATSGIQSRNNSNVAIMTGQPDGTTLLDGEVTVNSGGNPMANQLPNNGKHYTCSCGPLLQQQQLSQPQQFGNSICRIEIGGKPLTDDDHSNNNTDDNGKIQSLRTQLSNAEYKIQQLEMQQHRLQAKLVAQSKQLLTNGNYTGPEPAIDDIRFENLDQTNIENALVRRYEYLYSQVRVDVIDALDQFNELKDSSELKIKLLFSIIVLAHRSTEQTFKDIHSNIQQLLKIPEIYQRQQQQPQILSEQQQNINPNSLQELNPILERLECSIGQYLRFTSAYFDIETNVQNVCTQIWTTLFDYPCLEKCSQLTDFIRACVRLCWCMNVEQRTDQEKNFSLDIETRTFREDWHSRTIDSDIGSNVIKCYIWPTLFQYGICVHKGIVIT